MSQMLWTGIVRMVWIPASIADTLPVTERMQWACGTRPHHPPSLHEEDERPVEQGLADDGRDGEQGLADDGRDGCGVLLGRDGGTFDKDEQGLVDDS